MASFPPSLPLEIVRRVLLVGMHPTPPEILSFHCSPDTEYAFLKTACLVHPSWKDIALPLLYSDVVIHESKTVSFLSAITSRPTRTRWIKYLVVEKLSESDFFMGETQKFKNEVKLFIKFFRAVVGFEWPLLVQLGSTYVPISHGSFIASFLDRCSSLEAVEVHILEDGQATKKDRNKPVNELVDALRNIRSVSLEEQPDLLGRETNPFFLHLGRPTLTTPSRITSLDLRSFEFRTSFPGAREEAYRRVASQLVHLSIEDVLRRRQRGSRASSFPTLPLPLSKPSLLLLLHLNGPQSRRSFPLLRRTPYPRGSQARISLGKRHRTNFYLPPSDLVDDQAEAIESLLELLHPRSSSSSNFPRLKTFGLLRMDFIPPGRQSRPATTVEVQSWEMIYSRGKGGWLKWDEKQLMWPKVLEMCRARGLELKDDEGTVWKDGMGLKNSIQEVKWY